MSEDLINAENAYTDVKKRNEKLKHIINGKVIEYSFKYGEKFEEADVVRMYDRNGYGMPCAI